jgi:arylsulfatase A-like enzyme
MSGGKVLHHNFEGPLEDDLDATIGSRRGGPKPKLPLNWSPQVWDWGPYPTTDGEMFDFQLAEAAAEALQRTYDKPFFLSVGFYRPHVPMYVPPKWFDLFDRDAISLPNAPPDDLDDIPDNFKSMDHIAPTHQMVQDSGKWRGFVHAYLASTSFVDHCVGTVIKGLRNSPNRDNTIVVLWSDHGFHLGEKQHWAKRTLWEESTRVPFIIAGPDIRPGDACQEAVSLLDVYPTLLDLCGLPDNPHLEGISLTLQISDPGAPRQRPAITSSHYGNHAIRSRYWRYIRYSDGAEELYDHRTDPEEHRNLASDPSLQRIKAELQAWIPTEAADEVIPIEVRRRESETRKERQKENRPHYSMRP